MAVITLGRIFHSSGNPGRGIDYGDIDQWFDKQWISARKVFLDDIGAVNQIAHLNNFDLAQLLHENHRCLIMNAGSDAHQRLCLLAAAYLISLGKQPVPEQRVNGKRVDLITSDNEWIIECGDTDARPLLKHLYSTCEHFAVFPFDTEPQFLVVFERGTGWNQDVIRELMERPENIGVDIS